MPNGPRKRIDKRTAEKAGKEQQKLDRKRAQNRLSQQCYRERQAARIKQLAEMVEELESSANSQENDGRSRLELLKENQTLRESLLKMRKNLLSLASAASFSADDEIFKQILSKPVGNKCLKTVSESPFTRDAAEMVSSLSALGDDSASAPSPFFEVEKLQHTDQELQPSIDSGALQNKMKYSQIGVVEYNSLSSCRLPLEQPDSPSFSEDFTSLLFPKDMFATESNLHELNAELPPLVHNPVNMESLKSRSPLIALESTIREVISSMKFDSLRERLGVPFNPFYFSTEEINDFDSQTRTGVTSLAVRVLIKSTPLGGYVRVMGYSELVESIIQWRINPSNENRARIPYPFKPTVLQQRFVDHHPAIDFLFCGDIRDQLLLHMEPVDMDRLVFDCVRSIVREYPEFGVAVPVLDTFATMADISAIFSENNGPLSSFNDFNYAIKEDAITQSLIEKVRKYGLDRLSERKLSPSFQKAYPFLDTSCIVTALPVVDYQSIENSL